MPQEILRQRREGMGPKMMALLPRHRSAVLAYLVCHNKTEACRSAGYKDGHASREAEGRGDGAHLRKTAWEIFERHDVAEAILEETKRRLKTDLPINLKVVKELSDDPQQPGMVRLQAAKYLTQQGGLHDVTEQKSIVNITVEQKIREIEEMGKSLGLTDQLIQQMFLGNVSDAEFTEAPQYVYTPPTGEEEY